MSESFIDLKCNKSCRHIRELEQQKAELIEDLKFIAEQEDAQYINDILKKHGVEI